MGTRSVERLVQLRSDCFDKSSRLRRPRSDDAFEWFGVTGIELVADPEIDVVYIPVRTCCRGGLREGD